MVKICKRDYDALAREYTRILFTARKRKVQFKARATILLDRFAARHKLSRDEYFHVLEIVEAQMEKHVAEALEGPRVLQ
jgi:hypothetical protein